MNPLTHYPNHSGHMGLGGPNPSTQTFWPDELGSGSPSPPGQIIGLIGSWVWGYSLLPSPFGQCDWVNGLMGGGPGRRVFRNMRCASNRTAAHTPLQVKHYVTQQLLHGTICIKVALRV